MDKGTESFPTRSPLTADDAEKVVMKAKVVAQLRVKGQSDHVALPCGNADAMGQPSQNSNFFHSTTL